MSYHSAIDRIGNAIFSFDFCLYIPSKGSRDLHYGIVTEVHSNTSVTIAACPYDYKFDPNNFDPRYFYTSKVSSSSLILVETSTNLNTPAYKGMLALQKDLIRDRATKVMTSRNGGMYERATF